MEFRAVQQFGEHTGDLLAHNARPVVGHRDPEACRLAGSNRRLPVRDHFKPHRHLGQDACFFARIQRVIYGLFHAGQQRFAGIVETQEVPIFRKKFGDGNFPLPRPHFDRGHRSGRFISGGGFFS